MNNSSEISNIHQFNSSGYFFSNGTEVETHFKMSSIIYIICILMSFPVNSYVIRLIVTGTGNGLAAEIFILNLSVCEIIVCFECLFVFLNYSFEISWIIVAIFDGVFVTGHPLFECLICVERYLAVVHPVTFLKFKPLRYRLMCSAVVWVTTVVSGGLNAINLLFAFQVYFFFLLTPFLVFLSIKLFCCLAVLRALKQSGPGERAREREEENNMKKRAFYFILVTTVSMVITYAPYTIIIALVTPDNASIFLCVAQFCFTLAGLVQPVLFLYRVEKMKFVKCQ